MDLNLYIKIFSVVVSSFVAYHKYITKEIDKKVDKILYDKDLERLNEMKVDVKEELENINKLLQQIMIELQNKAERK